MGGNGRMWQMPISENARSAAAIHRKLRALGAVFLDPAATEHEKANAKRLKERLEEHLGQDTTPERALTGLMFRLGRGVKEITSLPSPKGDWTDHAFRDRGGSFTRGSDGGMIVRTALSRRRSRSGRG